MHGQPRPEGPAGRAAHRSSCEDDRQIAPWGFSLVSVTERPDFYSLVAKNRRATWGLLVAFFVLLALVSSTFTLALGAGLIGVIAGLVISGGMAATSYFSSDKIAIASMGAKPASIEEYPRLHNIVEGLSISAAIPKPRVYVVDDPAPNAFATGRNYENAAVAVTTGLLAKMKRDELEGVIAHELAHIRNYDILVMTVAVATAGAIALMTDFFWRLMYFGGGRRRDNDKGGNPVVIVGMILVAILAPLAAAMLKAAVSRRREGLADATAVELTRYPTGLRKALEKLDADSTVVQRTSHATSHLWIETPDDHRGGRRGKRFNDMFDTHPPLAERINTLRQMEGLGPYPGPAAVVS
ncbi:MAG: M48 family metalloprotease [Acidimicrobiales bacterium]|nr:M48 family metalloprotease [Acidimicrobiales bacterium]